MQIVAEARGKLRGSQHGRHLVELALVRVARLENLSELGELLARLAALEAGTASPATTNHGAPAPGKKKLAAAEPKPSGPSARGPMTSASARDDETPPLELDVVRQIWPELVKLVGLKLGKGLGLVAPLAILGPNLLVIEVPARYNWIADECGTPEARAKIEQILHSLLHRSISVRFERSNEVAPREPSAPPSTPARRDDLAGDSMIQKVVELFEARPLHLEYEEDSPYSRSS